MLIGAPMAAAVSIQFTIFVGAVASGVAVLAALLMTEAPHREPAEAASYLQGARRDASIVWRSPPVLGIIVFTAVVISALSFTMYLLQPFLLEHDIEVGAVFSLLQVPGLGSGPDVEADSMTPLEEWSFQSL